MPATSPRLDQLLTKHEAAELLGIGVRTVERLVSQGDLPHVRLGASSRAGVRFLADDLEEFVRTRTVPSAAPRLPGRKRIISLASRAERAARKLREALQTAEA